MYIDCVIFSDYFHRQSIRLCGYDYSQDGIYFVTICAYKRQPLFGHVVGAKMISNDFGNIVNSVWRSLPIHHDIHLDSYQIMPNHFHGILIIDHGVGATRGSPVMNHVTQGGSRPATLGNIIALFKSECTKQIRHFENNRYIQVWQRGFYEHIIRNEKSYDAIRKYIADNPLNWENDEEFISP